jgi:DsbC/DsbD-like thiol-disulfide interchange protein
MDRRAVIAGLALAFLMAPRAHAGGKPYRLTLMIADYDAAARQYTGGLEIELDHGWKTYWRLPGDAGIPPQFDWSKSKNVKSVEVLWPAPHRFSDKGGETIGYKDRVVFPLRIVPENPDDPVELDLSFFFGVCQDICIPGSGEATAKSGRADPAASALIAAFIEKVPRKVDAGSEKRIKSVKIDHTATANVLVVDVAPPFLIGPGNDTADLGGDIFVEGYNSAYFRAPRLGARAGQLLLSVDGLKNPNDLRNRTLRLTLVAGDIRLEQDVTVE